jgi:hypothetical protein
VQSAKDCLRRVCRRGSRAHRHRCRLTLPPAPAPHFAATSSLQSPTRSASSSKSARTSGPGTRTRWCVHPPCDRITG